MHKLSITLIIIFLFNCGFNAQWVQQTSGSNAFFYSISCIDSNNCWACGDDLGVAKIYHTTNGGTNWSQQLSSSSYDALYGICFVDNNTGWAVGHAPPFVGLILKTTNGGANWVQQVNGSQQYLRGVSFINQNTGCVVGSPGDILWTTNGGTNWSLQTATARPFYSVCLIDSNTGTTAGGNATYSALVYRTTNGGVNWAQQTNGGSGFLNSVSFSDNNNGMVVGQNVIIIHTTNGGSNWLTQQSGITDWLYCVKLINANTGFAVGGSSSSTDILKTTNGGVNWFSQSNPGSYYLYGVAFVNTSIGFAVGGGGLILKTTNGGGITMISPVSNEIPGSFRLEQNYPNPFNPTTKIKFEIPRESPTKLIIYDILGHEVTTLLNEKLNAGTYEASWDATGFSSGVYFYKLEAGDFAETKKMLMIK